MGGAFKPPGLVAEIDGAADQAAAEGAVEGDDGAFVGRGVLAGVGQRAGAVHQGAVFPAQGDQVTEEFPPVPAFLEAAGKQVAFELDAFLAEFPAVGGEQAPALVAGLAAGMDGRAVDGAEFLPGEQEGEGAGGEEGEEIEGAEGAGAEAVEAAAFVVVVGVAGVAGAGEPRAASSYCIRMRPAAAACRRPARRQDRVEVVVVVGVFGEPQARTRPFRPPRRRTGPACLKSSS